VVYCGYHTKSTLTDKAGKAFYYSFIGNPGTLCPETCAAANNALLSSKSPNADPGIDAQISILSHEIEETATDCEGTAWYNSGSGSDAGYENGDECAYNYGTTHTVSGTGNANRDGSIFNVVFGSKPYLIQQNFVTRNAASGGLACALQCSGTFGAATCTSSYTISPYN
jgi:hypothetical protein